MQTCAALEMACIAISILSNHCHACLRVDCSTVASKVQFIMDDLLWILTDTQMKAAVIFARHLKQNMDKANEQSKAEVVQTLQVGHCHHISLHIV